MQPLRMTRAEYEATYGTKPVLATSTLDVTPAPIRMTREEYNARYKQSQEQTPGLGSKLMERGKDALNAFNPTQPGNMLFQRSALRAGGAVTGAINDVASEVLSPVFNAATDAISDIPGVQDFATSAPVSKALDVTNTGIEKGTKAFNEFETQNPVLGQDLRDVTNIATTLPIGKGAVVAAKKAAPLADVAKTVLKTDERAVARVAEEIEKVENGYQKLKRVNDKQGAEASASRLRIAETDALVRAVNEDGTINTKQAVDTYYQARLAGKEDSVKKLLEREGVTINLREVENRLKAGIYESGLEGADLVKAINGLKAEMQGLKLRANGLDEIPLSQIHDNKISTTKHIDYQRYGKDSPTVTFRKAKAAVYKAIVEDKSKEDVRAINAELAKFYTDIERLRNLEGKKVKGGRLGKYFAQISGNMIGGAMGSVAGPGGAAIGAALGGEAAGFVAGKRMAAKFGGERNRPITPNQVLDNAAARAKTPAVVDLRVANKQIGAPPDVPRTPAITKIEAKIAKNVKDQKKAIKAGYFTLVATLKDIYNALVEQLKEAIKAAKENMKDQSGFANSFGGDVPQSNRSGRRNMTYKPTTKITKNIINSKVPRFPAEVKSNIVDIIDDYRLNKGKNLELQEDAARIAEDFGLSKPKNYGMLVGVLEKELQRQERYKVLK